MEHTVYLTSQSAVTSDLLELLVKKLYCRISEITFNSEHFMTKCKWDEGGWRDGDVNAGILVSYQTAISATGETWLRCVCSISSWVIALIQYTRLCRRRSYPQELQDSLCRYMTVLLYTHSSTSTDQYGRWFTARVAAMWNTLKNTVFARVGFSAFKSSINIFLLSHWWYL